MYLRSVHSSSLSLACLALLACETAEAPRSLSQSSADPVSAAGAGGTGAVPSAGSGGAPTSPTAGSPSTLADASLPSQTSAQDAATMSPTYSPQPGPCGSAADQQALASIAGGCLPQCTGNLGIGSIKACIEQCYATHGASAACAACNGAAYDLANNACLSTCQANSAACFNCVESTASPEKERCVSQASSLGQHTVILDVTQTFTQSYNEFPFASLPPANWQAAGWADGTLYFRITISAKPDATEHAMIFCLWQNPQHACSTPMYYSGPITLVSGQKPTGMWTSGPMDWTRPLDPKIALEVKDRNIQNAAPNGTVARYEIIAVPTGQSFDWTQYDALH